MLGSQAASSKMGSGLGRRGWAEVAQLRPGRREGVGVPGGGPTGAAGQVHQSCAGVLTVLALGHMGHHFMIACHYFY